MTEIISDNELLEDIKTHNKLYFTKGNKSFFGDFEYYGIYGKVSGSKYLITKTKKWSNSICYTVKSIDDNYKIGNSIAELQKIGQVKTFIKCN